MYMASIPLAAPIFALTALYFSPPNNNSTSTNQTHPLFYSVIPSLFPKTHKHTVIEGLSPHFLVSW